MDERIAVLLLSVPPLVKKISPGCAFKIFATDDVWVRDNGPIYTKDKNGKLVIEDWGFNGWGNKFLFSNCNGIPSKIAAAQSLTSINLNAVMIVEGGAVDIDGNGTLLATKSSILNNNRNPGLTQAGAEANFIKYLGVTNFIWLDGVAGLGARLPDGDGLLMLERWRTGGIMMEVPVIVLTASSHRQDIDAALLAGADQFVPKPCPGNVLALHVARALDGTRPSARLRRVRP